ncbi:hypothetical protein E2C01_031392 [Portunus trituberculatus]|uniref:Uncharacterized protein n=1 Tax=Portunus trituberculatus TaxID=210409 RepID=A0A5B7EXJ9_PORTR|nr:hypothetical protein [Portunus trituberculatus]
MVFRNWAASSNRQLPGRALHFKTPPLCGETVSIMAHSLPSTSKYTTEIRDPRVRPGKEPRNTPKNTTQVWTKPLAWTRTAANAFLETAMRTTHPPTSKFRSEKEKDDNDNPWVEVGKKKQKNEAATDQPKEAPTSRHQPSDVLRIIIPATEGFQSPVDAAEALESALNMKEKLPMKFLHSGQVVLSPPTMIIHDSIISLKELHGKPIHLQPTVSNISKGVLMKYPLLMPLSLLQRYSQVISTERLTLRDGEPTRQVLISVRGPPAWLPRPLELGHVLHTSLQQRTTSMLQLSEVQATTRRIAHSQ